MSPDNQYLYVTGGDFDRYGRGLSTAGSFSVIDISNRTNPQEVATLSEGFGYNEDMCLSADGKVAFITGPQLRSQDVEIGRVDIENPLAPVVIGWTEIRAERLMNSRLKLIVMLHPWFSTRVETTCLLIMIGTRLLAVALAPTMAYLLYGDSGGGIVFDIRNGSFEVASHASTAASKESIYLPSSDHIVNLLHW